MTDHQCPSCGGFCKKSGCERANVKPVHRPQPVRPWVGLTDEERDFLLNRYMRSGQPADIFMLDIELKLKEKNNG